ncbi:hypothetical protein T484DRAFT_1764497 [Baffinella frigidus]|nr:hypothetical protein T484DRAFT_1764497 [Cryptophyta sp. CCMP2293]
MGYSAVSASGNFSDSGDLYLWSGGGGEKRFARKKNWAGHEGSATSCAASADGQTLVTGGMEGIVKEGILERGHTLLG